MITLLPLLASLLLACLFSAAALADPVVHLDMAAPGAAVSPTLYGLMTEEINHSYDGGLYAELIQNRALKDDPARPVHWSLVQDPDGKGSLSLDGTQPIGGTALTTCLKLVADGAAPGHRVGVVNGGYWGIPVRPNTTYRASFYGKSDAVDPGPLTVSIEGADGKKVYATAAVPQISAGWQKYSAALTTGNDMAPTAATRFVIATEKPGTYWFNLVSLFPPTFNNRPNGNRADIMQLLVDMKPAFLRLPGGNYLEGGTIETRFPWKKTLGPLDQRPGHPGTWGYRSSDGLGLLEYMEWCEDMHAQPVLAVYAGYSLKGDHVEPGPDLQPFVDEALQEIEYVTGGPDTMWGAERMKDGHPAPFPLTYVEIGNEDGFDRSKSYDGRFAQFYDAIKAKYPNLKLIATIGGKDGLGQRAPLTMRTPDAFDEHYYRNAGQMEDDAAHYDNYSRTGPKIFVGEWATREGDPTTNLNAALGDGAWLTGMERNSDVVVLSCYAPLFVNVNPGGMQWKSDLIGYDTLNSYGSPSYYVQQLFNTNLGDRIVPLTADGVPLQTWQPPTPRNRPAPAPRQLPTLFFSATKASAAGTLYLKVVNTAATEQAVKIDLAGTATVAPAVTVITLTSAQPTDTNTIQEPRKIIPVASTFNGAAAQFSYTFKPYSVTVLTLTAH